MNICLTRENETNNEKFRSRSCSAKMTNKNRKPRSKNSKIKTSKSLKEFFNKMPDEDYMKYFSAV